MSMKNLILYGPFLWFRRIVLTLLIIILLVVLILYFIGNSSLVLKKSVEAFAPDYNITYERISGNTFSGFTIKKPQYNGHNLASNIHLKWNPNKLSSEIIAIDKVHVNDVNVSVLKALIHTFAKEDNTTENNDDSNSTFDYRVEVKDIDISLEKFTEYNVTVKRARLVNKNLYFKDNNLSLEGLDFTLETDVGNVTINGDMANRVVNLENIILKDINISKLMLLTALEDNTSKENSEKNSTESNVKNEPNSLMPKQVMVKHLHANILGMDYDPLVVKNIDLKAKDILFEVESSVVKKANVALDSNTNFSTLSYNGKLQNNQLLGTVTLQPKSDLYTFYDLPLRHDAIKEILVELNATQEQIIAKVHTSANALLDAKEDAFNVDVHTLDSIVLYGIESSMLDVESYAKITTPYAKNIDITNKLKMDNNLSYTGTIKAKEMIGFDSKFSSLLNDLVLDYNGTTTGIYTTIDSDALQGVFNTTDFTKADLELETKEALLLSKLVTLPEELNKTLLNLNVNMPLTLNDFSKINADVVATSNLVNINANVAYSNKLDVNATVEIPQDSLVKTYSKEVKWETLTPLRSHITLEDNSLNLSLNSETLHTILNYDLNSSQMNGNLNISKLNTKVSGLVNKKLEIETYIDDLSTLGDDVATIYPIEDFPALEGKLKSSIILKNMSTIELALSSSKVNYIVDEKTTHTLEDFSIIGSMKGSDIILNSYRLKYKEYELFSNKASNVTLGENIKVKDFWINDQLKVTGTYNKPSKNGQFFLKGKNLHIKDKVVNIYTDVNIEAKLDGNNTTLKGKVTLLKGTIKPEVTGRSFASDEDIIILQHMAENKQSPFMKNLSVMLQVETKKSLKVKQNELNIEVKPDITISKDRESDIVFLGSVALKKGVYVFQKKRFKINDSFVYFTGSLNKPLLDIKTKYKSLNHLITIAVTGTPNEPNINFSANPTLTREQILSIILFDTEAGGETHTGDEMMKMMGGAMAKAALSDVGVDVDHLVFGEGNSVEVGKKLTNKTTLIYINGEIPKVKLKYQHGKHTESVIGVSEESQSYDIIYKRDFH
ncbi:MAG: translocation/assembly module TamB domain-containing protein [Campylobacterota bacterium]|nr:translocation/assembly module TamB domain-containing protein [Campylobacterota bacterium]